MLAEILRNEREARQRQPHALNVFPQGEETRTAIKLYVEQNA